MDDDLNDNREISDMLREWDKDPRDLKRAFLELKGRLESKENTRITFKSRPGVSYSLRASLTGGDREEENMFALIDIIDDDPESRWLSVCFYNGTITDDDELGNLIPEGILGEDGYCFDLDGNDEYMISYLKDRIDEAHRKMILICRSKGHRPLPFGFSGSPR